MRNARIKRKRAAIKSLQSSTKPPRAHASIPIVQESKKVVTESELAEKNELEKKVNLYKRMARSFWERKRTKFGCIMCGNVHMCPVPCFKIHYTK